MNTKKYVRILQVSVSLVAISQAMPASAENNLIWDGSSASCKLIKFDGGKWKDMNPSTLSSPTQIQNVIVGVGTARTRFQASGNWYAGTANCFRKSKVVAKRNSNSSRRPASVQSESNLSSNGENEFQPKSLEIISGIGYVGQNRTLLRTTGTQYTLTATVIEFELGLNKTFRLSNKFRWGVGGGLGIGAASVSSQSAAVTYTITNQLAYSGRIQSGVYYLASDSLRIGLEPGFMYSVMSLPAPQSTTLLAPSSGLASVYWQLSGNYILKQSWGLNLALGMNQFTSKIMGSLAVTLGL